MKWKEILFGALVTLFVTVAGGLATYYFTKEPEIAKKENLSYSFLKGGVFEGGTTNISLGSLAVENNGGIAAENIIAIIVFDTAKIQDVSIESDSGTKESSRTISDNKITLTFDRILPAEKFYINLLIDKQENPKISIRSKSTLAIEKSAEMGQRSKINYFAFVGTLFSSFLLMLTLILAIKLFRGNGFEFSNSKNNAGFLLLHAGLVDEAYEILKSAVQAGQYDAYALSNLALCSALRNDIDSANKLIKAANFRDRFGSGKAIIDFNEALIFLSAGRQADALTKLKEAVLKSPKTIRNYCERSVHLDSVRNTLEYSQAINP